MVLHGKQAIANSVNISQQNSSSIFTCLYVCMYVCVCSSVTFLFLFLQTLSSRNLSHGIQCPPSMSPMPASQLVPFPSQLVPNGHGHSGHGHGGHGHGGQGHGGHGHGGHGRGGHGHYGHEQGGHGHDGHVRPHQNASIHKNVKSDLNQCGQYLWFLTQQLFGVFLRSLRICAGQHTWIISNFKTRNQLYIASVKTKLTSKRQDPSFEHCPQGFRKFSDPCSCSF